MDIHRKDNAHSLKKEITVFGSADVCNQAIAMILQIMQDERATLSKVSSITSLLVSGLIIFLVIGKYIRGSWTGRREWNRNNSFQTPSYHMVKLH